jgi:hypothetical protein
MANEGAGGGMAGVITLSAKSVDAALLLLPAQPYGA